jgi:hypothetical protein
LGKAAGFKGNFFACLGAKIGARGAKKRTTLFLVLFLGGRKKAGKLKQQKNCFAPTQIEALPSLFWRLNAFKAVSGIR